MLTGLRVREAGLIEVCPLVLPAHRQSMTLCKVQFRGQRLDIRVACDPAGAVHLTRQERGGGPGTPSSAYAGGGMPSRCSP
jgi:hypothetical protein